VCDREREIERENLVLFDSLIYLESVERLRNRSDVMKLIGVLVTERAAELRTS